MRRKALKGREVRVEGEGSGAGGRWYVPAIAPLTCTGDELLDALAGPVEPPFAGELVVVEERPGRRDPGRWADAARRLTVTPCVVVAGPGWRPEDGQDDDSTQAGLDGLDGLDIVDLVAADAGELEDVVATVRTAPVAATALALHLRQPPPRTPAAGLVAESALFSALQAGPEHAAWRRATPVRHRARPDGPVVAVDRHGDELRITLDRPEVRNAVDRRLRDELLDALAVAEADPALRVTLDGRGPSFCAGGDLDEFGTAPDPALAHLVRVRRSVGAVLSRLAPRTTVQLHGTCHGAGIELAAFAHRVVAAPDTRIALPEVRMGLAPGAGGTVSIPARVGRHRTAWLGLTGRTIDAATAAGWGLVDELDGRTTPGPDGTPRPNLI